MGTLEALLSKLNILADLDLDRVIEEDPDHLETWFEWFSELDFNQLLRAAENGQVGHERIDLVLRGMRFIMQLEHAQAEELKELIEREAVEAAEREENWSLEREALREETRALREGITSRAGIDNVNEAFRAEIDSLTAENEDLRQQSRDRERELGELREKAEELETKIQILEKERSLLTSNQTQMEETIREMSRRLNTHQSEVQSSQRINWESRKLRQRNEQALILSDQVKELASQNDELRAEADRLMKALSEATELIQDNAQKWKSYSEQLEEAERMIERLTEDNKELKDQLKQRDEAVAQKEVSAEITSKEFVDMTQSKMALIDELKTQLNRKEIELEELRGQFKLERSREREEELERLRIELVEATESAKKLFGALEGNEWGEQGVEKSAEEADPTVGLRLRLIQTDMELETVTQKLNKVAEERLEMESMLEQKDLMNVRLLEEIQRYREMAFGDKLDNVIKIEKQLEFRDRQIKELIKRCSLLQIENHELQEGLVEPKARSALRSGVKGEAKPEKHIHWKDEEPEKSVSEIIEEKNEIEEDMTIDENKLIRQEEEKELEVFEEIEKMFLEEERIEKEEEIVKPMEEIIPEKELTKKAVPKWSKSIEEGVKLSSTLYGELKRLRNKLEDSEKEMKNMKILYKDRENHLTQAKSDALQAKKEYDGLRMVLFGNEENAIQNAISQCQELKLIEQNELLEQENIELRRLRENLSFSGNELERRMAEGAHRRVFLAIRNSKLERQTEIGTRLRLRMAAEIDSLQSRNRLLLSENERRMKQLILENETKTFEIARIQNALFHSVPLSEYKRLQKKLKQIAIDKCFGPDAGYCSASDDQVEDDDHLEEVNLTKTAYLKQTRTDELMIKLKKLEQLNEILEGQNDSYKREMEKSKSQIDELEAFLDDIEKQTELKSLIVNIERRFLQAIREQFNISSEREVTLQELKRLQKQAQESKAEWEGERSYLINVVFQLKSVLHRVQQQNPLIPSVTLENLTVMAKKIQDLKDRENDLVAKEKRMETLETSLNEKIRLFQATKESVETIVANDYQLERLKISLQGYQLNILSLSAELKKVRSEIQKKERKEYELLEEVDNLQRQMANFQFVSSSVNISLETGSETGGIKQQQKEPTINRYKNSSMNSRLDVHENGNGEDQTTWISPSTKKLELEVDKKIKTIVVDNSREYEEQIKQIKEATLICIETYKIQLEQKEKSIEEYRNMLHELQKSHQEMLLKREKSEPETSLSQTTIIKSVSEILDGDQQELLEKEKKIMRLEKQVSYLKEDNEELQKTLSKVITELEAASNKLVRDAEVQVELLSHVSERVKPKGNGTKSKEVLQSEKSSIADGSREDTSEKNSDEEEEEDEENVTSKEDSDSGTVDDIENGKLTNQKASRRESSVEEPGRRNKKKEDSGSTYTLQLPIVGGKKNGTHLERDNQERLIMGYRNDIRRLRLRVSELERQNKQLSEEYSALRERNRYVRPRVDPDSELGMLRKENERFSKQNSELTGSLKEVKQELDNAQKTIKKTESALHKKVNSEIWEERKRNEQTILSLKQKLNDYEVKERSLIERLERREKLIAQMERAQSDRSADAEQFSSLTREWRKAKEAFSQKETELRHELEAWTLRHTEMAKRVDTLTKENKILQNKLTKSREKPTKSDSGTQTEFYTSQKMQMTADKSEELDEAKNEEQLPLSVLAPTGESIVVSEQQTLPAATTVICKNSEHKSLDERLRRSELLKIEALEELNSLKMNYDQLLLDYNRLLGAESERRRSELIELEEKSLLGVALLADKLKAKDREIDEQRAKYWELVLDRSSVSEAPE